MATRAVQQSHERGPKRRLDPDHALLRLLELLDGLAQLVVGDESLVVQPEQGGRTCVEVLKVLLNCTSLERLPRGHEHDWIGEHRQRNGAQKGGRGLQHLRVWCGESVLRCVFLVWNSRGALANYHYQQIGGRMI